MEICRWCESCVRTDCDKRNNIADMDYLKPICYASIEMVKFGDDYVPKELCAIDAAGVADALPCSDTCKGDCNSCIVTKLFNEYARMSGQLEKISLED